MSMRTLAFIINPIFLSPSRRGLPLTSTCSGRLAPKALMEHFSVVSCREEGPVGREAGAEDGEEGFESGEGVGD